MARTRTRFAPSPTGMMHVGNLRTAIFEYLVAKHDNGDFLLRVEDTDQARKVDGAIEFIYDTLKICNISVDEGPNNPGKYGPYMQSERKDIYKKYALELVDKKKAYYCFCSEERLEELREKAERRKVTFMYDRHCANLSKEEIEEKLNDNEPYVIRQLINRDGVSSYEDMVYGKIEVENSILEDQILLKSDGFPTYNFANVIDDHLMEITHIIRGNEYVSSTPKYNQLYDAFGWERPTYIHVPMVLGEDGQKLSKRNGDASFMDLYNQGYLPEAVVNYLILLGWSPETNEEIFSMEELIKIFDPKRITKSGSIFDTKKLQWINTHYIKLLSDEEYLKLTLPHLQSAYDLSKYSDEWVMTLVNLYKDEIKYGKEIIELSKMFFLGTEDMNEECMEFMNSDESINNTLEVFQKEIENITDWSIENLTNAINNTKVNANVKGKLLYMPIRIKITNIMHGPELPNTLYLLGKEKVLESLKK